MKNQVLLLETPSTSTLSTNEPITVETPLTPLLAFYDDPCRLPLPHTAPPANNGDMSLEVAYGTFLRGVVQLKLAPSVTRVDTMSTTVRSIYATSHGIIHTCNSATRVIKEATPTMSAWLRNSLD